MLVTRGLPSSFLSPPCSVSSLILCSASCSARAWTSVIKGGKKKEAAARKRSHQWCLTLTPNNTETIERMTCHCFLRPIRRGLTSSSYTTVAKCDVLNVILGSEASGIKTKEMYYSFHWASRWFLLFYSPRPRSQVWILIYGNWSIAGLVKNFVVAEISYWLFKVLSSIILQYGEGLNSTKMTGPTLTFFSPEALVFT